MLCAAPGGGRPSYMPMPNENDNSAAGGSVSLVGDDAVPTADQAAGLEETDKHTIGCLPNYRCRINEVIKCIKES